MEDAALLEAFVRDKSDEAFKELVRRHVGVVYSVCRRRLRDEHWAEDVTQAVFILLCEKAPTLSKEVVLGGWLYRTAFYACSNARDLMRTRSYHETRVMQMKIPQEENPVERAEMEGLLDEGLMGLNKGQREVLVLRFFENKTLNEVAKSRRESLYATQKALDSGLARLRKFLAQRGVAVTLAAIAALMIDESAKAIPSGLATTVGVTALNGTTQVSGHIAQVVSQLTKQAGRTKLLAIFASIAACILLGLAGLNWGNTLLHAAERAPIAVVELSPAQQAQEMESLWRVLRETEDALRRMDTIALSRHVLFSDPQQHRQWNAMARVFEANLALKQTASARFGADAAPLTAISTFGERFDAVLPIVDVASCQWTVNAQSGTLHFAYRDGSAAGGTLFFVKDGGEWRIDATRSIDLSLEGLNSEGKRDALDRLSPAEQAAVWEKIDRLATDLSTVRGDVENGKINSIAEARSALQSNDTDDRAFFRIALRFDNREALRN